jgi:hypothetical protein
MQYIDELSKSRATLRVLKFINENGETKVTGLVGKVAGQKGVYQAIETLLKLHLITERTDEKFPHPRLFSLTSSGKTVASCLQTIEKTINESASINTSN